MRALNLSLSLFAASLLFSCQADRPKTVASPLLYYVISQENIDGGRFIDTPDFPKLGYIRPVADLVITTLKDATTNILHTRAEYGTGEREESWSRAATLTFFVADAEKIAELKRQNIGKNDLLWMIGDKPLGTTFLSASADPPDSVRAPTNSPGIVIPLRKHQNAEDIHRDLKRLVRH